jgi:hypothetical protein
VFGLLFVTETVGSANPLIVIVLVLLHPLLFVPVTVYVTLAVDVGVTDTVAPVVPLRLVPGLHVYVFAPEAVIA